MEQDAQVDVPQLGLFFFFFQERLRNVGRTFRETPRGGEVEAQRAMTTLDSGTAVMDMKVTIGPSELHKPALSVFGVLADSF